MSAFFAITMRDLRLALRNSGDMLTFVLFFILIGVIVPFAIGPDKQLLAKIAPGIVWIAAFLASLLALDRLFRTDHEDGGLTALRHASISLEAITFGKLIAHWLSTALPLMLAMPIMAVFLNMGWTDFWRTELSLFIGTPALTAFGALGAALTVSLRRGALIAPVLILPLSVPILIFGTAAINSGATIGGERAALLLLGGISLMTLVITPFAAALALKLGEE
jgi:heme exporter protein B